MSFDKMTFMEEISNILTQLNGKDIFIHLDKENPDWIKEKSSVSLVLFFGNKKAIIPLDDDKKILYLVSSLPHCISESSIIISWFAKDIFSYFKGKTGINLDIKNKIYDLFLMSSYFGISNERPKNIKEAFDLFKKITNQSGFRKFLQYYNNVHFPLLSITLPEIETNCLVDNTKKSCVYPTYILEGQLNGRLKTVKINSSSYNPHSIGNNEKLNLRPKDYDDVFIYFDYKNMEVNVLQWLSKDPDLKFILECEKDLYKKIWEKITKQEANDNHRTICKNIFLPVVFGQGYKSLSKKIGISEKNASKIINNLVSSFPVAFDWVNSQSVDSDDKATDFFGRKRIFSQQDQYKIKNFCIQSPASMICLRKLVRLHEALSDKASICFHVHDGYCVICKKSNTNLVSEIGIRTLEENDDLFPGLNLKTTCNFGNTLNSLKQLKREVFV